jgi:hypothetical protein
VVAYNCNPSTTNEARGAQVQGYVARTCLKKQEFKTKIDSDVGLLDIPKLWGTQWSPGFGIHDKFRK